ncbi:ribose-phosphate pyrophosphokinase 1 [Ciborinia camelliae]|nr:ribose-phosphate pyrophosphokinase 1 [Ciborinia camelliae]
MRNTLIFAGSSCPKLTDQICTNLGMASAPVELTQFANGETSVKIMTSIREKDVFVVQSGSSKINDSIMELLIMISACKGGSANKITAVLPYFPYSRQSKKKSHRGAITARMLANLLHVAGINHVITVDLHASQMQARWIRRNVPEWKEAVCVSKNAGGTKRVTSLADALKLNFGMVTTDKRRTPANMSMSMIMSRLDSAPEDLDSDINKLHIGAFPTVEEENAEESEQNGAETSPTSKRFPNGDSPPRQTRAHQASHPSPQRVAHVPSSAIRHGHKSSVGAPSPLTRALTTSPPRSAPVDEVVEAQYTDERAREVTHGRLVQGHIVSDDYPSPTQSAMSSSLILERPEDDPMSISMASSFFSPEPHALGGTADAAGDASDEEEEGFKDPSLEQMITLVGDVRNRTVFIVDDMIDKAGSWIAAAETVVKRGGAKKVYCIATHGLFGGDALEELQNCDCIDMIVVTNSFPISQEKAKDAKKLQILDLSKLLSEAIRRNHYGESISALFTHSSD